MKKYLKLFWGENFYQKPKSVISALEKAVDHALDIINEYPGAIQNNLIKSLAIYHNLKGNQFVLGNGIESLIHLVARSYVKNGTKVAFLSPTFGVYKIVTINYGGIIEEIPLTINQTFTANKLYEKIKKTLIFFLAYPNNPTGHYIAPITEVKKFLVKYQGFLIVDECYFGIGKKTTIDLINKFDNLIVLRSLSKNVGLAGLRFGYAVSNKKNIDRLKKFSKNIEEDQLNIFSCLIAQAILPFHKLLIKNFNRFKAGFLKKLNQIPGIEIIPTNTTFVLVKVTKHKNSQQIIKKLAIKYKIFVKNTIVYDNFPKHVLMFAVPKKSDWNYFFQSLTEVVNS